MLGPERDDSGRVKVDLRVPVKLLDVCTLQLTYGYELVERM